MNNVKSKTEYYPCPCCGYKTMSESVGNTFEICPICFWEDDGVQLNNPDYEGGANKVSLNEARKNFKTFGACEEKFVKDVRSPLPKEF